MTEIKKEIMSRETQRQIFECEHLFGDKPKIITRRTAVRPRFETIS